MITFKQNFPSFLPKNVACTKSAKVTDVVLQMIAMAFFTV